MSSRSVSPVAIAYAAPILANSYIVMGFSFSPRFVEAFLLVDLVSFDWFLLYEVDPFLWTKKSFDPLIVVLAAFALGIDFFIWTRPCNSVEALRLLGYFAWCY